MVTWLAKRVDVIKKKKKHVALAGNTLGARSFSYAVSGFGYFRFRLSLCLTLVVLRFGDGLPPPKRSTIGPREKPLVPRVPWEQGFCYQSHPFRRPRDQKKRGTLGTRMAPRARAMKIRSSEKSDETDYWQPRPQSPRYPFQRNGKRRTLGYSVSERHFIGHPRSQGHVFFN